MWQLKIDNVGRLAVGYWLFAVSFARDTIFPKENKITLAIKLMCTYVTFVVKNCC